jgi:spermidine synthase
MTAMTVHEPMSPGLTRVWELDRVLYDGATPYQYVVIGDTAHGRTLFSDGDRQSSELSQLVYHEALMLPGLLLADRIDHVLIIGSSEGVASQIAVAAGARHVDHVDIDEQAVRLCAEHLPYGYERDELAAAERGDGPVRVHYADGWRFVEEAAAGPVRYDLVVIDLPDERPGEEAQHNRLYGIDFLRQCEKLLAPGGVVASQAGCPTLWRQDTLRACWERFAAVFATCVYYGSDEHEWAFVASRADLLEDPVGAMAERLATLPYRASSIDTETLVSATVPPPSLRVSGSHSASSAARNRLIAPSCLRSRCQ